jgi:DNA-binding LacI/PurR family transcriptional regulator
VDGLIDLYIHPRDPRVSGLSASGQPFVLIGIPDDESLPHVTAGHFEGGFQAGRAFVRRGYSPVGYIGLADSPASWGRLAGLSAALEQVGQSILPPYLGLGDRAGQLPNYEELGWSTMRSWLKHGTVPRALLTAWDAIAYGALQACRESGCRVPDELAIIGFDDEPPSRLLTPALATVQFSLRELGGAAATLLLQLMEGTAPDPPRFVVPTTLVERASLG